MRESLCSLRAQKENIPHHIPALMPGVIPPPPGSRPSGSFGGPPPQAYPTPHYGVPPSQYAAPGGPPLGGPVYQGVPVAPGSYYPNQSPQPYPMQMAPPTGVPTPYGGGQYVHSTPPALGPSYSAGQPITPHVQPATTRPPPPSVRPTTVSTSESATAAASQRIAVNVDVSTREIDQFAKMFDLTTDEVSHIARCEKGDRDRMLTQMQLLCERRAAERAAVGGRSRAPAIQDAARSAPRQPVDKAPRSLSNGQPQKESDDAANSPYASLEFGTPDAAKRVYDFLGGAYTIADVCAALNLKEGDAKAATNWLVDHGTPVPGSPAPRGDAGRRNSNWGGGAAAAPAAAAVGSSSSFARNDRAGSSGSNVAAPPSSPQLTVDDKVEMLQRDFPTAGRETLRQALILTDLDVIQAARYMNITQGHGVGATHPAPPARSAPTSRALPPTAPGRCASSAWSTPTPIRSG